MTDKYFNTNQERGATLKGSKVQVSKQEDRVAEFFRQNRGQLFKVETVNELVLPNCPHHSAARAVCNLTEAGVLEKTDYMQMGKWGKMVHTWRYREKTGQMRLPF